MRPACCRRAGLPILIRMLPFPEIDPIALQIGPLAIRWYGLSYITGIGLGWWLLHRRAQHPDSGWNTQQVADVVFYAAIGAVLGGRFGYVLFYNFSAYVADPLDVFKVWQGGMSFHGGLLGALSGVGWFARSQDMRFWAASDFVAPAVPIGLFFGRVANFINAELWGARTDLPWGVVFPHAGEAARHPSQLYEAGLEGVVLFLIVWQYARSARPAGTVSALFLIGYGCIRCLIELVREPDQHIGFLAFDWLTMGQVLSVPMILFGAWLFTTAQRAAKTP